MSVRLYRPDPAVVGVKKYGVGGATIVTQTLEDRWGNRRTQVTSVDGTSDLDADDVAFAENVLTEIDPGWSGLG